ncbi:hypothetical protein C7212DRAFT_342367 [Tuber magnatum]|uniref:Uncharacterized protein n=1 Tax=Tuber magnatum TaxID=42249 RepID=A0A317SWP1_9PEZI|nr:hypothetical protein C7212DRAFT_342367 [Tuber magnatum]
MVYAIVKKATLRCLDIPMTFKKIEDITAVSISTASDIWRHAFANARNAGLAITATIPVPTALTPATPPAAPPATPSAAPSASLSAALSAAALSAAVPRHTTLQTPVLTVLLPTSTLAQTSILDSLSTHISNKEFSLMELISASVLGSDPHSGRPPSLSEGDKDKLVKLVKKDFVILRMALCDIRREAGLSYVSKTTVFQALQERGIGAYLEVFKFILSMKNQKKWLHIYLLFKFL